MEQLNIHHRFYLQRKLLVQQANASVVMWVITVACKKAMHSGDDILRTAIPFC
jgi:hypothetical protein